MRTIIVAALAASCLLPQGAGAAEQKGAQSANGAPCSDARLAYCRSIGQDDSGYGPAWKKNHCSKSPYGPRFEYLVPVWNCMRAP